MSRAAGYEEGEHMPTPTARERKKKAQVKSEDLLKLWPWGVKEFIFSPDRNWRFDWCDVNNQIAVELDGYIYHTLRSKWIAEKEKMNWAAALGYTVFHFTPDQVRNGEADAFMQFYYDAEHNMLSIFTNREQVSP